MHFPLRYMEIPVGTEYAAQVDLQNPKMAGTAFLLFLPGRLFGEC